VQEVEHQKQALQATYGAVAGQINPESDRLPDEQQWLSMTLGHGEEKARKIIRAASVKMHVRSLVNIIQWVR
jgi:hypothetical protein